MPFSRNATLHVDIDSDASGVSQGVDKASGSFAKLGSAAKLGGLAVAGGLVLGVKAAVDFVGKASDLNETISKSQVIFGKHADAIDQWAKRGAENLGLSEQAALDAATSFGDMFSQIGFSGDEAAKQSKTVVQLATDLGSFNNLDTADVLDRLSGAFRGEYDSLQAVLPNISAARVQQEALNETHKKSVTELTAAEKATATLTLVQKDGKRAAGDFARTSGGLANQQKILRATLDNVETSIGKKLLPIALDLIHFVNKEGIPAVREFGIWFGKHLGPALASVGAFITKKVIPALSDLLDWFVHKIIPALEKDVQPILDTIRDGFGKLADKVKENGPQLKDLLGFLKDVAEFIAVHLAPVIGKLVSVQLKLFFDAIGTGIDIVAGLVQGFKDLAHWGDVVNNALRNIHVPDLHLPHIPGLSAPSYALDPGRHGTAGWGMGSGIGDLLGGAAVALSTALYVDRRDFSLSVKVDGSGIVDERAIAAALIPVLQRHADRIGVSSGNVLTAGGAPWG